MVCTGHKNLFSVHLKKKKEKKETEIEIEIK